LRHLFLCASGIATVHRLCDSVRSFRHIFVDASFPKIQAPFNPERNKEVTMKRSLRSCLLALCSAVLLFQATQTRAAIIADSITEFSSVQDQNGWNYGYRVYADGETDDYDATAAFIEFAPEMWTGTGWDLDSGGAAPWTFLGAQDLHPNGSNNGEVHWVIRRWTADELTAATPVAIIWNTRKQNTGGGNGVTGFVFRNGVKIASSIIAGNDGTGVTNTNYITAAAGDRIDLVLSPGGTDGLQTDGADGSFNWMRVETTTDTDSDGLADSWENIYFPGNLAAMNAAGDNDSDGVTNKQEQDRELDPTKADTDGDGLNDGVETNTGTYVSVTDTGTNPALVDTDRDGRRDGDEVNGTVKSDPTLADTDNDGFSDGSEVTTGHNPTDENNNPNTTAIANSQTEFSGNQGENDWQHGYRVVSGTGAIVDYAASEFIPFPGGADQGDWVAGTQLWTGTMWDMNTAAAGPWTELGAMNVHPNGPSPLHWVIRRWTATELTQTTPLTLRYFVRKTNTGNGGGNGVTAGVFLNGKRLDSVTIAGNNGTGVTRTVYANVAPGDVIDVILSPRGLDNSNSDGQDGSEFRVVVDPTLPENPRQPDGTLFIPANAGDTDGDGIPDVWEQQYAANLTTFTQTGDFDADGLNDVGEYNRGTDPTKADTDGDGLSDKVETKTGTFVSAADTGSNPTSTDSDGDGLNDSAEVTGSPATNPNKSDSDGDTFSDPAELQAGTNPNDAGDNPLTFVIANSQAEFSGVQGQNGWFNGYRNYSTDGGATDYNAEADFIRYAGGSDNPEPYNGDTQMWNGGGWDLATVPDSGPWTEQGPLAVHPNGVNSAPGEEHWTIRRWVSDVTAVTPVAIIWNAYDNNGSGGGITGSLHINGQQVDFRTAPASDPGQVRRFYVNLKPGDIVDLAVTPEGPADRSDGNDGSSSWFWVDTKVPAEARQPDGSLFIPAGAADTDADGLPDFWERLFAPDLTTLTANGDNDNDTLSNTAEFARDSSPISADTDSDGLGDAAETGTGTFVSNTNAGSSARDNDSDDDGLSDGAEVNTHGTDPNDADTDDDTFSDAAEIASGHDPKDTNSNPSTSKIADSVLEFTGVQGQDGWRNGYRNYTTDGGGDYTVSKFIEFAGGADDPAAWDGVAQMWTGNAWDINTTADVGPWTEMAAQDQHPNGVNSAPNQEHWPIRRWVATELTAPKPLALRYHVRKTNTGSSAGGVSAMLYINGTLVDSVSIAGDNGAGVTRTFYADIKPGDIIDLAHTPVGPTGDRSDGADGSALWLQVDSVLPPNPVQPNGTPFVPGGGGDQPVVTVARAGNTLTITWTNGGTLYSAPTVNGPWATTNDSDGSFTTTTPTAAGMQFFRVQR
jgi:hypothetical protein